MVTGLALPALAAPAAAPAAAPQTVQKTIFDYQQQLGLTDAQVAQIKSAVQDRNNAIIADRQKLKPAFDDLKGLLAQNAPLDQIRAKWLEVSGIQVDIRIAILAMQRKVNAILKPEQLAKWRKIQQASNGNKD